MLRFDDHGVGYAHLTLPADTYRNETQKLRKAAEALDACIDHRVCYLAGQSDVMLALRLNDVRAALGFEHGSEASGTNWLFGVPYIPSLYMAPESKKLALTYIVHLRIVRDTYRALGVAADEIIVSEIQALLKNDIRGEVLAGFGWSDLMIAGTFDTIKAIVESVRQIQRTEIDGRPAIRRVLTIVGYDSDVVVEEKPTDIKVRPVMLARAAPTRIRQTAEMLKNAIDPTAAWTAISMDGKWDILLELQAGQSIPLDRFITKHRNLAESQGFISTGLERLETHLLTMSVEAPDHDPTGSAPPACSCRELIRPLSPELMKLVREVEPSPLAGAIRNVLGLFRAASKDPHNCCEIASALERYEIGLRLLLQHRSDMFREMKEAEAVGHDTEFRSPAFWFSWFKEAHLHVQEWCTLAERIISQRTVGRFEEFLSQNERVVSYRGGVQKLLSLTDALLNSYAAKIRPDAATALPMVCLFDPVDIVLSHRYAGLVRMPARYLFVLPLAINHLWHEVGAYAFHQKYVSPQSTGTRERLRRVAITHMAKAVPRVAAEGAGAMRPVMTDFTVDLGDVSADAMTLIHGFRGDVTAFIISTATALLETPNFKLAPSSVRDSFLTYLLLRLYLALECRMRVELLHYPPENENSNDAPLPDQLDAWNPDPVLIQASIRSIVSFLKDELLIGHKRYEKYSISEAVILRAVANVNDTVKEGFRPFLKDIVLSLNSYPAGITNTTHEAFEKIFEGNVIDLAAEGMDINDVFRLLQARMIEELRNTSPGERYSGSFFRAMAALTRSSILSFYKLEKKATPSSSEVVR